MHNKKLQREQVSKAERMRLLPNFYWATLWFKDYRSGAHALGDFI